MTSPQRTFVRACALADVPENGALGVEVEGTPVAVVRAEGELHALYDVCSHAEVALSEGEIYDHTVECWLHGSCFDLRTGNPTGPNVRRADHSISSMMVCRLNSSPVSTAQAATMASRS